MFTLQRQSLHDYTDEIPLCTQILEQVPCHEKAGKLLVSFAAATSNLYAQDLKHVHQNSNSSASAIKAEVDIIRSIIDGQRFEGRRQDYNRIGSSEEYNHMMQSQKYKKQPFDNQSVERRALMR